MGKELTIQEIQSKICCLGGHPPAIMTSYIAEIYQVRVGQVKKAVYRHPDLFPEGSCFLLDGHSGKPGRPYQSWMFTSTGAIMLSTVLRSSVAEQRSVQVMRAFLAYEEVAQCRAKHRACMVKGAVKASADEIVISKDEYIDLLKSRVRLLRKILASEVRHAR